MKRTLTLLSLTLCTLVSMAQITFTNADLPSVPWTHVLSKDTSIGAVNWGNKGANQVYNFTSYQRNVGDTAFYIAPTPTQTSTVPNANMAITGDHVTYLFARKQATLFDFEGIQSNVSGSNMLVAFSPIDTEYKLPVQYGSNFHGTYGFTKTVSGSSVGQPAVNQVRVTNTTHYFDTIDGWGKVITPAGTYNCLRQKRVENSSTLIEYNLCGICPWTTLQTVVSNTTRYYYLTKETHGSAVSFNYDSLNNPTSMSWSTVPPAPTAKFGYTLGASGAVAFHDSTTGTPVTYSWNFGDGTATASSQNPNHSYTANGTYYVCLTATNVSGTSTWCDSVHITNIVAAAIPPTAGNDTASMIQPGSVTINVLANDVNHNPGDTLCVTAVWGAPNGWTTQQGCNSIVFDPTNTSFTGLDTFYYKVCDIHIATLCDTAMVVVNVKAAQLPPTAHDDTASVLQPGTVTINATANDVNHNVGTSLCITSVWGAPAGWTTQSGCNDIIFHALDSTFMGLDTFYYKVCDQQQPTLCDTGMVVVNVTMPVVAQPVIGYDFVVRNCGFTITDTTLYADSTHYDISTHLYSTAIDTVVTNPNNYSSPIGAVSGQTIICITAYYQSGTKHRCDTVSVICSGINEISSSQFRIYPNPASDQIQLDLSHVDQATMTDISAIEVCDILGDKLKTIAASSSTTINVHDLSNGVYLIGLLDKNNTRRVLGKFEIVR